MKAELSFLVFLASIRLVIDVVDITQKLQLLIAELIKLLLHYHSHEDKCYKECLLAIMIHRAYQLSSTPTAFSSECHQLPSFF